uniref:Reverse transcriptase domain-containing protein n=1 Tax=Tanacetum cinerariifolium TaxID=118510 RepID=A0A6L2NCB0_TANCI|nr:hypothetical protein [Tanacetum cinerariifolium]
MSFITAQQVKLDLELAPEEKRLEIRKCNGRLNRGKIQREPTFQVIMDALALTSCYSTFLITADVPEVYMHQFWDSVYKHDTFYRFKMDKRKRFKLNLEIFRYIFKIFPHVQGQDFDALPTDEEIVSFLRELVHIREINPIGVRGCATWDLDRVTWGGRDKGVVTPSEPVDSLNMRDEHLNTILATKSDEFIKSCVENLVPNLSESEGENECDVPAGFTTFSNVLFNVDYDFDSGDDQSTFDQDFLKKIYSNPLFDEEIISMKIDQHPFNAESDLIDSMLNHDYSINISSKTYSLFDEFVGELTLLKSISPGIDETDCHPEKETRFAKRFLYDNSSPRPPEEFVSDNSNANIESFSPSPIPNEDSDSHMEEINLPFTPEDPMPPGIEDDDYHSGMDIPILEELLDNYSLSLPANESYHFDIPSPYHPPAKPPDGKTGTLNIKMLGDVSDQKVKNKQEKDKTRTKPDQIKKRREAWISLAVTRGAGFVLGNCGLGCRSGRKAGEEGRVGLLNQLGSLNPKGFGMKQGKKALSASFNHRLSDAPGGTTIISMLPVGLLFLFILL